MKEFDNVGTDVLKYTVYKSVKCVLSIFTSISIFYLPITKRKLKGLKIRTIASFLNHPTTYQV